jgi:hypothetical protein
MNAVRRASLGEKMAMKKPEPDDPEQYKRFLEAAKEADEKPKGADKAFRSVVSLKGQTRNGRSLSALHR